MPEPERVQKSVRGRGRPRSSERLEPVSTRLPIADYDRLIRAAGAREMSVSMLVRRLLILRLP